MGDMGDVFAAYKEAKRKQREARLLRYEPLLERVGATYKAEGIYEYNGWLCYPTKGFGMLKKNNRIRKPLRFIIKEGK